MRVLVTGAAGAIGKPVCEYLAQHGHDVRRFDRVSCGEHSVTADIADAATVLEACAGMDGIVHLAATPDDAPFLELVSPNVIGCYNVLDAARNCGVKRVFLASSVQVGWSQSEDARRSAATATPRNHYALLKLWAEQMAEMYCREHGLSVVAGRIGWMVRDEREARQIRAQRMTQHYISRRDVACFIERALVTPELTFAVLYAIGPDGRADYDLETPRALLGYEPQDHFPAGLPFELPPE